MTAADQPSGRVNDAALADVADRATDAERADEAAADNAAADVRANETAAAMRRELDEAPDNLPPMAWVTLGIFALFVIGAGGCMATFMFN